ncbi:MAG TPA: hypothetical protein VJV75_07345, partial [Candidatus Polarisedimenticolia bacterium]|nr:hypothetical protein [Candidatus Polarisedimenticolia bacterium]
TCLLEMGYVEESVLGRALSELFGVGYAPPHLFENIPRSAIDRLPRRLVEKHLAVPFDLRERNLDVALIDPKNLPAIDTLAFATGLRIVPWVSPEARIFQVMERYYGVQRRQRYITVCSELDRAGATGSGGAVLNAGRNSASAYVQPAHLESFAPSDPAPGVMPTLQAASAAPEPGTDPQRGLTDTLCRAEGIHEVAEAALGYASKHLLRTALFLVKGTSATLWCARGTGQDGIAKPQGMTLSVTNDPLFELLLERTHFRGPLPSDPRLQAFYAAMKMDRAGEAILVPGYMDDRLVICLYGDGGPFGGIEADTDDLRMMVARTALALQLLVMKKKIRSLELPPATAPSAAA